MQIINNNINAISKPLSALELSSLRVGQVLQVEILSNEPDQEGLINLNGKMIKAQLEAQVQTGDKFLAVVKEADQNSVILSRESLNNNQVGTLSKEQIITLINRGVGLDTEVSEVIAKFNNTDMTALKAVLSNSTAEFMNIISLLLKIIPKWSDLNGQQASMILQYLCKLGLEDERQLFKKYKNNMIDEVEPSTQSVKNLLLKMLAEKSVSKENTAALQGLLDEITGQQLWIQTGTRDNAYALIHLPLQDNGFTYNCSIAVESSRKGEKSDIDHCHIALQVETENLGKIGADLRLYEKKLNICVIHSEIESLDSLIRNLFDTTKKNLSELGFFLDYISLKTFEEVPQFVNFIGGKFISGVDVKG